MFGHGSSPGRSDVNYGNLPHRGEAVPPETLREIFEAFNLNLPLELVHMVFIICGVAWAFRGKMDHDVFTWNDVIFGEDAVGKFVNVKPHFFKNHNGGVNGKHRRQEARALYQLRPDDPKDPYNVIVEYRSRVPVQCLQDRVYRKPNMKSLQDAVDSKGRLSWYQAKNGQIGHNTLAPVLKHYCTRIGKPTPAGGIGKWKPHGLRATGITNNAMAGTDVPGMLAFGGHAGVAGLMHYITPDERKRLEMTAGAFHGRQAAEVLAARLPEASIAPLPEVFIAPTPKRPCHAGRSLAPSPFQPVLRPATPAQRTSPPVFASPFFLPHLAGALIPRPYAPLAPRPPAPPAMDDGLKALERLSTLKTAGVLTSPEFKTAKAKVLVLHGLA